MSTPDSGDFVQSLARGLSVIRAFDADHAELTLSEVARRAGITRAAARRFLLTLETLGYVRGLPGAGNGGITGGNRAFSLTPRVLELGFSYLSSLSLPEIVQPHLEALSREVGESVSAAVLDGADIVYIARVPTRRIMSVRITIGTRFPAYATSMGRVLLAGLPDAAAAAAVAASDLASLTDRTITDPGALRGELDRVRAQGWAVIDGELEPGLRSIAAPLHGRDGSVIAALNVSTSATRDTVERLLEAYLPPLLRTAGAIDAELRLI
ncbi:MULTISPECIES: IclR family transcriptional regulator C-terminal domain-containing protein [unclassified Microbacterium]|uniref:IclR family transcriptional regulator domain-containing protein n=1 Tax=unclassified Microbacterium TaxID=2609290 RepID=UPI00214B8FC1|nr:MULTISPECIES: IclR family transcriptional regulator C-terminal domain-containing protein [unclassified Microbacterium]MCR2808528.1 helix-turn-helix domain-containing protein [Microbacterium sp. zg.B185]WIM19032.1 IclR family transcriptional regulator C-terminal domain-containing protein [Microbacterium sp. zg-B185]